MKILTQTTHNTPALLPSVCYIFLIMTISTFLHTNIRGIRGNKEELIQLLNEKNISAASINETFLTNKSRINIPGYNIIRKERQSRRGGGVAILIRKNIEYSEMDYGLSPQQLNGNEYVAIRMKNHLHHLMTIISIYCPPGIRPSAELFQAITTSDHTLIMGDFNAKHTDFYCNITNTNGNALKQILNNTNLLVINTNEPTYISPATGNSDILDLILCTPDLASKLLQFSTTNHLSSDHLPVLTTFSFHLQVTPNNKYNYRKADWEIYRTHIEGSLKHTPTTPNTTPDDLDHQAILLSQILTQAREETIPKNTNKTPTQSLPHHILQLIKQKRKLRRNYIRSRSPQTKREINRLQTTIKLQLSLHRQNTWKTFYKKLDHDTNPRTFWQKIKSINGDPQTNTTPPLKSFGTIITDNKEKATLFRNHLENTHSCPNDTHFDNTWKDLVDKEITKHKSSQTNRIDPPTEHHLLTRPVTTKEIQLHLMKNKALGEDTITIFRTLDSSTPLASPPATSLHPGRLHSSQ